MQNPPYQPIEDEVEVVERRQLRRVTLRNFLLSILDAFNIERGGVYTLKRLIFRPGHLVLDYLGAHRFRYVPPFRLLLVTTAVALIGMNYFFADNEVFRENMSTNEQVTAIIFDTFNRYLNILLWAYIPFIAAFTLLFNRKAPFNFAEHLVFNTYLYSFSNLIMVFAIVDHWINSKIAVYLISPLLLIYYIVAYRQFFKKSWWRSALELIVIMLVSLSLYSLVSGLVLGVYAAYQLKAG